MIIIIIIIIIIIENRLGEYHCYTFWFLFLKRKSEIKAVNVVQQNSSLSINEH